MAAKPEAPPAAAAAAPADAAAAPKKSGGMMGTLIPVVVVIVLAPAISWAVAQFVIVPQLRKGLAAPAAEGEHAAPAEGEHAAAMALAPLYRKASAFTLVPAISTS